MLGSSCCFSVTNMYVLCPEIGSTLTDVIFYAHFMGLFSPFHNAALVAEMVLSSDRLL